MIEYFDGTIFNAETQGIVNTINIVGVMGNGIALEYKLRYPKMFEEYKQKCEAKELKMGKIYYYHVNDDEIIINFPTKYTYKYPSQYSWVESGLKDFVATYKEHGITSAAFPRLGCNLGQLSWKKVQPLMEKYLSDIDCKIKICEDLSGIAAGTEKRMVDAYNDFLNGGLIIDIDLTTRQKNVLKDNGEISRFWTLKDVKGVSAKTYEKLFNTFYFIDDPEKSKRSMQMTLF